MKNLFIALFAFVMAATPAFADYGTIGYSSSVNYAGTVQNPEQKFINIKASAAIAAGQIVSLDLTADDGGTGLVGPTTGLAPICIAPSAIASGAVGKCQTHGLLDAALFDSTNSASVAGKRFYMSTNNAGYASARVTELATEVPLGYFYDVASASGTVQVFIKL